MDKTKVAAIWCRVSTNDQRELSLETQEALILKTLEDQGYLVPPQYIIKVDWSSMDLLSCPQFRQLRQWVAQGQIQALGTGTVFKPRACRGSCSCRSAKSAELESSPPRDLPSWMEPRGNWWS